MLDTCKQAAAEVIGAEKARAHEIAEELGSVVIRMTKAEASVAGLEQLVLAHVSEVGHLRGVIEAKDAAILAMKREGFDPPDPRPPTTHEIRAKLDPQILHRIEQIAQPGTKEHYVMLQEAEALVGAYPDRPAEQIADEVTEGCPISPYRL